MWNHENLPLFDRPAGDFVLTIRFADQIPQKPIIFKEIQALTEGPKIKQVEFGILQRSDILVL